MNKLLRIGIFVISLSTIFYFYFLENSDSKGAVTDFLAIIEVKGEYSKKIDIKPNKEIKVKEANLSEGDRLFINTIREIYNKVYDSKVYSGKAIILGVNSEKGQIYPHLVDGGTYIRTNVSKEAYSQLSQFRKNLSTKNFPDMNPRVLKQIDVELKNKISQEDGNLESGQLSQNARAVLKDFSSDLFDDSDKQVEKLNVENFKFNNFQDFDDLLGKLSEQKQNQPGTGIQKHISQELSKKISSKYSIIYHRPLTRSSYDLLEKHCKEALAAYDKSLFNEFKTAVFGKGENKTIWYRSQGAIPFKKNSNNKSGSVSPVEAIADYLENNISVKQTHFYLANSFLNAKAPKEVAKKFVNVISKNPDNYFHFIVLPQGSVGSTQGGNFAKLYQYITDVNNQHLKTKGKPLIELRQISIQRNFFYQKMLNSILDDIGKFPEQAHAIGEELEINYGRDKIFRTLFKQENGKYIPNDLKTIITNKLLNKAYLEIILQNGGHLYSQGQLLKGILLHNKFGQQREEIIASMRKKLTDPKTSHWKNALRLLVLIEREDYQRYSEQFYLHQEFKERQTEIERFRRSPSSSISSSIQSFNLKDRRLEMIANQSLTELFDQTDHSYSQPDRMLDYFLDRSEGNPNDQFIGNAVLSWFDEESHFDILTQLKILSSKDFALKEQFLDLVIKETSVIHPKDQLRFKALPLELNKRFYFNLALQAFSPVDSQNFKLNDGDKQLNQEIIIFENLLAGIALSASDFDLDYPSSKNIIISQSENDSKASAPVQGSITEHIIGQIFHKDFRYTPSAIMAGLCIIMSLMSIFYLRVSSGLVTGYKKGARYIFAFEVLITAAVVVVIYSIIDKEQYLISPKLAVDDPLFNGMKYTFYFLTGLVAFMLASPFVSNFTNKGHLVYFTKLKLYSAIKSVSLLLPYLVAILIVMIPSTPKGLTFANLPKPYAIYFMLGLSGLYLLLYLLHFLYEQDAASYKPGLTALNDKVKEFVDQTVDYRKDEQDDPTTMLVRAKGFDFKEFIPVDVNQGLKDISLSASLKHGAFMYPLGYSALQGKLLKKDFDLEQMGDMMFVSFISDDLINSRLSCISRVELRQKTGAYMAKAWLELVRSVYSKWTFSAFFPRTNNLLDYYIVGDVGDVQEYFNAEIMEAIANKKELPYLKRQVEKVLSRIPLDMDIVMLTDTYFANDCRELIARFIQGTKRMGILINIEDQYKTAWRAFDYYGAYPDMFPEGYRLTTYKKSLTNLLEVTTTLPTSLNQNFRTPLQNSLRQLIKKNETQI